MRVPFFFFNPRYQAWCLKAGRVVSRAEHERIKTATDPSHLAGIHVLLICSGAEAVLCGPFCRQPCHD